MFGLYQYNKTFFFGQQLFLRQFPNPRVNLRRFSLLSFPFHYLYLFVGETVEVVNHAVDLRYSTATPKSSNCLNLGFLFSRFKTSKFVINASSIALRLSSLPPKW